MAISGEIPNRAFNNDDSVFRETPRPLAASVTVNPKGSKHNSLTVSPGCGGLNMPILSSLMVINIIYIYCINTFKTKSYSPVS